MGQTAFNHRLNFSSASSKRKQFRATKIISTIKYDKSREEIVELIDAGMNIARFDGSKCRGDFKNIEVSLEVFRKALNEYNENRRKVVVNKEAKLSVEERMGDFSSVFVATALEINGLFYETGLFQVDTSFNAGGSVNLTTNVEFDECSDKQWIYVNFSKLLQMSVSQIIIIGMTMKLKVISVDEANLAVKCLIMNGGVMTAGVRHEVNIPGVKIELPSVSEDILSAITFCKRNDVDILIVTTNDPNVIKTIRLSLVSDKATNALKLIAKIEDQEAVNNIDGIIEGADGVMLCRSRLGRNISPEQVIMLQKKIIAKCLEAGVSSIVSSDILESMKNEDSKATRAEIVDIVNIVLDGVDCIMLEENLSTETCTKVLRDTIKEAEDMISHRRLSCKILQPVLQPLISCDFLYSIAFAACTAAIANEADAIIVLTDTGKIVEIISRYRPEFPIIAVAKTPGVARKCLLYRGVFPINFEGRFAIFCYASVFFMSLFINRKL